MEEKKEVALSGQNEIQSALIEIVKRADIDPDRLEKFLDIQIKMEERQNKAAFQQALSKFQGECPVIKKTSKVSYGQTNYSFSPLDEIVHIAKPHLLKNGLSFSFNTSENGNKTTLTTTVYHENGYSQDSLYIYDSLDDGGKMSAPQKRKSAMTYAKRAALENALGIVTAGEDDDARRGIETTITQSQIDTINEMLRTTKTDFEVFARAMRIETLESLSDLEAKKAIHALKRKRIANV